MNDLITKKPDGFSFRLTKAAILGVVALAIAAIVVLGLLNVVIGPNTARAGYLAMLFLLSPVRTFVLKTRVLSACWAVVVAVAGFLIGGLGFWPMLIGVMLVCIVQGMFRIGEIASLSRSPVNFVVFAGIGATGSMELWHVIVGSIAGASVMLLVGWLNPQKSGKLEQPTSTHQRLWYGFMFASGSVLILLLGQLVGKTFTEWTLLTFCMILSVGFDNRVSRVHQRMFGTIAGALFAALMMFAPEPAQTAAAAICGILGLAYINMGNYALFVAFLTPAILLTSSSELPGYVLAGERVIAGLVAAGIALAVSWIFDPFSKAKADRFAAPVVPAE